ncbi:MAG TPA: hypothetical protein VLW65_22045 [Bryobacteraceae bacterium]|nr:hypothetical protein [Bryobacteraceae bacterium]
MNAEASSDHISGSLQALFLFDAADEIHLEELRAILEIPAPRREPAFRQPAPEYVQFARPPVIAPLTSIGLQDGGRAAVRIAYYDYGVVSVKLERAFEGSWTETVALAERWMNTPDLERCASEIADRQLDRAMPALLHPYAQRLTEDYNIVHLARIVDGRGKPLLAADLTGRCAEPIAQIVRGEAARFSAGELAEILESRLSYYDTDLLVVGWSAALIYDTPEGAAPTIQLLEYANTQLLDFRHYDNVLTGLLSGVYRTLERRGGLFTRWRFAREADRLNTIRLDIRELTERVDNSIKFLSDMFAARLYRMAALKIGVADYRKLVDQKLESAGELYAFMMDNFYQARAFALEAMVVVILIIELVFLFRGSK